MLSGFIESPFLFRGKFPKIYPILGKLRKKIEKDGRGEMGKGRDSKSKLAVDVSSALEREGRRGNGRDFKVFTVAQQGPWVSLS